MSSPQLPAARLSGVQGKIAEVNVAPKVVVWNSTDPPTGTTVTDGSNHFPGTSVTRTTTAAGSACEAIRGSDDTTNPTASSPTTTFQRDRMRLPLDAVTVPRPVEEGCLETQPPAYLSY